MRAQTPLVVRTQACVLCQARPRAIAQAMHYLFVTGHGRRREAWPRNQAHHHGASRRFCAHAARLCAAAFGLLCCGQAPDVPTGPAALAMHVWPATAASPAAQKAHPEHMPPARWAVMDAAFVPSAHVAGEAEDHLAQAKACANSNGLWHAGLWACTCPVHTAFVPHAGCLMLPHTFAAKSVCTDPWASTKTACLRDIQAGRTAWHLHFAGRAKRTQAVRQALVDNDLGALVGHTLTLPPADVPWTLHITDRGGPEPLPLGALADGAATFWPSQYTQLWTRITSAKQTEADARGLTETCARLVTKHTQVPAHLVSMLCAPACAALEQVRRAAAAHAAWPPAQSAVHIASPPAAGALDLGGPITAVTWQLAPDPPAHPKASWTTPSWRVVLRDGVVLARTLQVSYKAPEAKPPSHSATWTLTLLCDGTGAVQAWHVVDPSDRYNTGVLVPCPNVLQPRQAKRARTALAPRRRAS